MTKKTVSLISFVIIGLGILSNMLTIFLNNIPELWIYIINIVLFMGISAIIFIFLNIDKKDVISKNKLIEQYKDLKEKAISYEEVILDSLLVINNIGLKIKNNENNITEKKDNYLTNIKNEKLKNPDDYKKILENLKQNIDINDIELIRNYITEHIRDIILDIYIKIPYLNKLIDNIKIKSEKVIHNMIDKFTDVSDANSKASREAEKNIMFLKNIYGGKDFEDVAKDSKEAYKKTKSVISKLIELNKENRKKLDKIEMWIKQINRMLENIQDIAEQNKTIAINSSIEAARIGEAGRGFRVLVQEIQQLNQKTSNFTKEINDIMTSFENYNETMINEWDSETKNIIGYMEQMIEQEEKRINKFIESFELTIKSFQDLSESAKHVDNNLNHLLNSLQFEDITGQQIKHIKEFLIDIHDDIKNKNNSLEDFEINLDQISKELDKKIRDNLSEKVTVLDEKIILDESIMEN